MTRPSGRSTDPRVQACRAALGALEETDADGNLSDEALQALLAWTVRAYAARLQDHERDAVPPPFPPGCGVSETDALLVARSLLDAFELVPFELAMLPR